MGLNCRFEAPIRLNRLRMPGVHPGMCIWNKQPIGLLYLPTLWNYWTNGSSPILPWFVSQRPEAEEGFMRKVCSHCPLFFPTGNYVGIFCEASLTNAQSQLYNRWNTLILYRIYYTEISLLHIFFLILKTIFLRFWHY